MNGNLTEEEAEKARALGLIVEDAISETLEICEKLKKAGVDLSKVQWTKRVDGKDKRLKLREIEKEVDIEKIIAKNELNPEYPIGQRILYLRSIYNGTIDVEMSEEERKKAETLELIIDEQQSTISELLEICEKLKNAGIDLSKIQLSKRVNGKKKCIKLGEIETEVDIGEVIAKNELNPEYPIGQKVMYMKSAYNGTIDVEMSEEERERAETLGLIRDEQQSAISELLEICEKLKNAGIDLSKIQLSKRVNGKKKCIKLGEIETEVDIREVIAKNELNLEYPIGQKIQRLRRIV